MGGEADGGRGVGEKMKDIEDVEAKKMSEEDRNEMIEIAKIKARKNPEKEK